MKASMRESLKEALLSKKKEVRGKRAKAYGGEETEEEEEAEERMESKGGSGSDNGGLSAKVSEAEDSAHEELEEAGNWRGEEMQQFMKKRPKPSVRKEASFAAVAKSAGKGKKKG